ncbi:hypothetical protein [Virgibacillus sp. SK37]|uniref:hypothetical protein n=1 Tax=Virgibacillus sp. SK37 TaxID=403957 RepID=UPI0004D0FDDA|nr:hypothetical protein [Virgibacillus sp. SK37]AIF42999.1 hypothetical protein X953_07305 [Virgibacillus sp. SK37]
MDILITIAVFIFILFGFSRLMGYRNENITLELDDRYTNLTEQAKAVKEELEKEGRKVEYRGDGYFLVDGKNYVMHGRNVAMGGVPLQRTILEPVKK